MKKLLCICTLIFACVFVFGQVPEPIVKTPSITELILGGICLNTFLASLFFAMVGVTISLLVHANSRDQATTDSPVTFKWWFLLKDNWKRILLSFIMIIVTLRFVKELTGLDLNMFVSLCVGLVYDKLAEYLKSKSDILQVPRV